MFDDNTEVKPGSNDNQFCQLKKPSQSSNSYPNIFKTKYKTQYVSNGREYVFPIEIYKKIKKDYGNHGPLSYTWTFDNNQVDDVITKELKLNQEHVKRLRAIISPEQRTEGWYKMRKEKITASDGGCVLGVNDHEPQYKFLLKKTGEPSFKGNQFTHHGKKFESIATMIYEHRLNVTVGDYGLLCHPKYNFLGASPDGIVGLYKKNGKHLTKYVGRMVEIKCPLIREIKHHGGIFVICPEYYWVQVQLQLECCDLDECDFWQCSLYEYSCLEEYLDDTQIDEPYLSKQTGFEKGCVIQLLPILKTKDMNDLKYQDLVHEHAIYIYPPRVDMSPYECNMWIADIMSKLYLDTKYFGYYFDRVIYWRLNRSNCLLIKRDKKWFADSLPVLKKMWDYVTFFRNNLDKLNILVDYIQSMKMKMNTKIMKIIDVLYNVPSDGSDFELIKYAGIVNKLITDTNENKLKKEKQLNENSDDDSNIKQNYDPDYNQREYAF